jgi:hypothetical protein
MRKTRKGGDKRGCCGLLLDLRPEDVVGGLLWIVAIYALVWWLP